MTDTERRDISARLENWARWTTSPTASRVAASQTGAICERLRREAEGNIDASDERRKIDEADAVLIERNLWKLRGTQRTLLRMHYVTGWRWQPICRLLQLPVKKERFDLVLKMAQTSVEQFISYDASAKNNLTRGNLSSKFSSTT